LFLHYFRQKHVNGSARDKSVDVSPFSAKADPLFHTLMDLISPADVKEVFINHNGNVLCRGLEGLCVKKEVFCSKRQVSDLIWSLAWESKVRLDPFHPFAGGILHDRNLRWHAVIPPLAPDGPNLALRKQMFAELSVDAFDFENFDAADILRWQEAGISIAFFGPTGCGKSTLMYAFLKRYFHDKRVGIIEGLLELPIESPFWFRLVQVDHDVAGRGRVDFGRVTVEMLRLSPQMIVIGEIRGDEVSLWNELSKTGHGGILTTFHAGSPEEVVDRFAIRLKKASGLTSPLVGVHVVPNHQGLYKCRAEMLD
jgi:pilus assembly protein CpaF